MRIATTARIFPPEMEPAERIRKTAEAGFEGIEFNFETNRGLPLPVDPAQAKSLVAECRQCSLEIVSVYSRDQWSFPISSNNPEFRKRGVETIRDLIRGAGELGCSAVLVIPGIVDTVVISPETREVIPYEVCYQRTRAALEDVIPEAEKAGVALCLENVWSKFLPSPMEFRDFVDMFDSPNVRAYFDIANSLTGGFPEHWIPVLGKRIERIHVKDIRTDPYPVNSVVNLFDGEVNWPEVVAEVVAQLAATGYDGWLTAEVLPAWKHFAERFAPALAANMRILADAILAERSG